MFTPSSWTGETPKSQNPKLNVLPNSPFYYMHHPFSWELVEMNDSYIWLPSFSILREMAGVNGVEQTPQGPDSTVSRMRFTDRGYTILDREFGYVARYETIHGGYYYCNKFNVPKIIGRKVFWNMDSNGWNEFRLSLIENNVLIMPEIEVIEEKRIAIDRKIERRIPLQHLPEIKKEIDSLYQTKKQMTESFNALISPPKSRRKNAK
jgi:hypothetical protein